MRIKIISNGEPGNTQVIDIDTGEALKGVEKIEWTISGNSFGKAVLHMGDVPVEILETGAVLVTLESRKPNRRAWWRFWE